MLCVSFTFLFATFRSSSLSIPSLRPMILSSAPVALGIVKVPLVRGIEHHWTLTRARAATGSVKFIPPDLYGTYMYALAAATPRHSFQYALIEVLHNSSGGVTALLGLQVSGRDGRCPSDWLQCRTLDPFLLHGRKPRKSNEIDTKQGKQRNLRRDLRTQDIMYEWSRGGWFFKEEDPTAASNIKQPEDTRGQNL